MHFDQLASQESITKTSAALAKNNFEAILVSTKEEALTKIKELVPAGASVMNGTSKTLEEIGYVEYLKAGQHGWNNLHAPIVAEPDRAKQKPLRDKALFSDFYLGSVHALTETGELVIASNTGSQMPHIAFTSPNLIFVVSTQKITPTLQTALQRIEDYVVPLEDVRMKGVYGVGTTHAKTLILHKENPMMGRKIKVILVNEKLGF
jgi:L-lactate utilization protein LutC